jgi:hypothetical protein
MARRRGGTTRRASAGGRRKRAAAGGAPRFPGRTVGMRSIDAGAVLAIQRRLNRCGCGPLVEDGIFGPRTAAAVRLFQARFPDAAGHPLEVDGVVGPITWAALFGPPRRVARPPADPLVRGALAAAAAAVGVMENPPGSNRGPEVDRYLRGVGIDPTTGSYAWCAAFVYACFDEAARKLGRKNPLIRTAGVLDHWQRAGAVGVTRITAARAHVDPGQVRAGQIFIIDVGAPGGAGHTGLVEQVEAGRLTTIEGNTNDGGSREGVGVFRRRGRKIGGINVGFLDYAGR